MSSVILLVVRYHHHSETMLGLIRELILDILGLCFFCVCILRALGLYFDDSLSNLHYVGSVTSSPLSSYIIYRFASFLWRDYSGMSIDNLGCREKRSRYRHLELTPKQSLPVSGHGVARRLFIYFLFKC